MYSHIHRSCLSLCCWQGDEALQHGCHEILAKPPCQPGASLGQLCQLIRSPCEMIPLLIWGCSCLFANAAIFFSTIWYQYDTNMIPYIKSFILCVQLDCAMSAWDGGAGEVLGSVSFWSQSGLVESGLSNQLCLPWHVIWHHVMFQWETTWDDCTICSTIARVSIPLFRLVHLQCFPLDVNIRSEACTKFNCTHMCIPCTVQSYAVFDFLCY